MMAHMPLTWSDNRLAIPSQEMITTYRFEPCQKGMICRFIDHEYRAKGVNKLAALLVKDGLPDGTVQFTGDRWYHRKVHLSESLHGMAALWRNRRCPLKLSRNHLKTFFSTSGRGLRRDVKEWWKDALDPMSRPWRVRHYSYLVSGNGVPLRRRAQKSIDECLDFASDQDVIMFRLKWL